MNDKPEPRLSEKCKHEYRQDGRIGLCISYRCIKCGDEYEKDVS